MVTAHMMIPTAHFELQGHRGARGLFPENTLEGIAATIALGVDAIELDVAVTADGVAVVFNDVALNADIVRAPSGDWIASPPPLIKSLTVAELGKYDVGRLKPQSPTSKRFADQTPIDGARIPTLAQVFAITVSAGVRVDAELKTLPTHPDATVSPKDMAELVIATARDSGALDLLDLRAFDWRGLLHSETVRPGLRRTWLTSSATVSAHELWWGCPISGSVPHTIASFGGGTWAPEHVDLTESAIQDAHSNGVRVIPWTVNEPTDIERLIDWGTDGICTDRPDIARAVMQERGLPLPPSRTTSPVPE
jgi:glycerophosphoryl diester phosphodiesterase